jgi:hypothetical protein
MELAKKWKKRTEALLFKLCGDALFVPRFRVHRVPAWSFWRETYAKKW